jgi:hypothetical protein
MGVRLKLFAWLFGAILSLHWQRAAGAVEAPFYAQCRKFLPIADTFAQECLQRARPFTRTFFPSGGSVGEAESYSTYFKSLAEPSHFLLGCVLDFKHKINFVGLYYAARPTDMARFEEYGIVFVDPNDNVGVAIDGDRHTLIAVRQFVTDVVPPRLTGRPKNCEDAQIETIDGASATAHQRFRKIDKKQMEYCSGTACRTVSYTTLLGMHSVPLVYSHHDVFLIDANGVLMIKDAFLENICSAKKGNTAGFFNLIYEACPQKPK